MSARGGVLTLAATLTVILVVLQAAEAKLPPVMCLLERLIQLEGRDQLRYITCNRVPALGVYHLIPLTRLCDEDREKMPNVEENAQELYDKCCRLPRPVQCTDDEWRIVARVRYRTVFCTYRPDHCIR
ncbi:uncharacterized protein LOC127002274 [Eriocheir sinensis]|uniref:uncharacterized protein LOC127002274 n=1 Tax=Eriocheir sinensis TaxID=95602 RepID=UPI0021CA1741|nr:uncharacterized protein LOC127002274 [Eriocheir sinensis]